MQQVRMAGIGDLARDHRAGQNDPYRARPSVATISRAGDVWPQADIHIM